jgi:large subunit ribosomal protein L17
MRHLKSGRKLGRTTAHRKALFRNLVTALIQRERVRTTLAKAKELRKHAEKTITLGKKGTLHARRLALKNIQNKEAFLKLFGSLSERYASRNGGYTRILKVGNRRGDDAPMAIIELVDRDGEAKAEEPKKGKKADSKKAAPKKAEGKKEKGEEKSAKAKKEDAPKKEKKTADKKEKDDKE